MVFLFYLVLSCTYFIILDTYIFAVPAVSYLAFFENRRVTCPCPYPTRHDTSVLVGAS